jgi:mono/diheme cytochrome c family protein
VRRIAITLLLVLVACDWSLHRMQEQPRCTVHGATELLPNGSCDLVPPPEIVAMTPDEQPPPVTRALLERGRDRFERICAACHGLAADGDSQVARAMTLRRPPSLIDTRAAQLTDARILTVMESGYGMMPAYRGLLAPRDRHAVLNYLRVLQQRITTLDMLPPALQQEASRWLH